MTGSAISGGAARAASVVWWSQRHQRLPPQAELLPRILTSRALELAHKTAAAAALVLLADLVCSAGPTSLTDLCDDLIVCIADKKGSTNQHGRLVKPSKENQTVKQNIFFPFQLKGFTMELLASAVLGDIISRSISFFLDRYYRRQTGGVAESLERLRPLLLRVQAIVEEAERRNITNQAMLRQLDMLRHGMYRGYYMLDAFTCRGHGEGDAMAKDEVRDESFTLCRFRPAKRLPLSQDTKGDGLWRQGAQ
ncbi:hypothetical protein ACQ4PT_037669 [Festuca glaucescens]